MSKFSTRLILLLMTSVVVVGLVVIYLYYYHNINCKKARSNANSTINAALVDNSNPTWLEKSNELFQNGIFSSGYFRYTVSIPKLNYLHKQYIVDGDVQNINPNFGTTGYVEFGNDETSWTISINSIGTPKNLSIGDWIKNYGPTDIVFELKTFGKNQVLYGQRTAYTSEEDFQNMAILQINGWVHIVTYKDKNKALAHNSVFESIVGSMTELK